MDGKYKFGLGAAALIIFCITVIMAVVMIALWQQREIVAWCMLALAFLVVLVLLAHHVNEMSLRRRRFHHGYETPLDVQGRPVLLHPGQSQYPFYVQRDIDYGAEPHDGERGRYYYGE